MEPVFLHDTEKSKTFYFWPITDMSSGVGALWWSCLTVTVLCRSTWMTWRRRTSVSSSASTSWRREYSRSTRRAVKMYTVRWVLRNRWTADWLWVDPWMAWSSCSSGTKGCFTDNKTGGETTAISGNLSLNWKSNWVNLYLRLVITIVYTHVCNSLPVFIDPAVPRWCDMCCVCFTKCLPVLNRAALWMPTRLNQLFTPLSYLFVFCCPGLSLVLQPLYPYKYWSIWRNGVLGISTQARQVLLVVQWINKWTL